MDVLRTWCLLAKPSSIAVVKRCIFDWCVETKYIFTKFECYAAGSLAHFLTLIDVLVDCHLVFLVFCDMSIADSSF